MCAARLERARADYERCVEFLDPIADRARVELRECRRYVRALTEALEASALEPHQGM